MVLELLGLLGLPVSVATAEGIRHNKELEEDREEDRDDHRMQDFHIEVFCDAESRKRDQVDNSIVVLRDEKLYLTKVDPKTDDPIPVPGADEPPHLFNGFFLDFQPTAATSNSIFERLNQPPPFRGLVSTISEDPPTLNWIYIDRNTFEVKYGSRAAADGHILGPWDWTDDELGLMLEEWEGFVAVEEDKDTWSIYYDRDDNGLKNIIKGRRVLRCSLERKVFGDDMEDVKRR
ncbi:hypothetical protein BT63DRAFT_285370 [Microthyrium microscopicum]|uniref:Uncharacterized protein n=1 Tax=Microthyrium microscopicum TaxID=703497 RepID=A0A6A6U9C6_9PEZI|nr:hypothetical protein BT63DRAFT_285370 [Microthyrium microscopicum]